VAIAPEDAVSVAADGFHTFETKGCQFVGLEDPERVKWFGSFFLAGGARAGVSECFERYSGSKPIVPLNDEAVWFEFETRR